MRLRVLRLRVMFAIALGAGLNSIPGTTAFAQSPNLCGYPNTYSGWVSAPNESFVSPSNTAATSVGITFKACMTGPANANFDLLLYKTLGGPGGGGWSQVATGVSTGPNQRSLSFEESNGTNYILKVRPNGGSGNYTASWRTCLVPSYAPAFWNSNATIRTNNNCYNYATNTRTDTFAQPGRASGAWCPPGGSCYDAATISTYTANDGLTPVAATHACPPGVDKVALVIWPGTWPNTDYHFYRQDVNGMWSHKPGPGLATNLDNSNAPISNPQTASRAPYTVFAGYFCTCSSATQGAGGANIN